MSDIDHSAAARALIEPLTGYTPGPWKNRGPATASVKAFYVHSQKGCRASVYGRNACADADLIAAAPDLRDMVATLADALAAERAENQRLRKIIDKMDEHSPRADHTCAEPGITLSEAVMRAWPELAEPKDEVSE